MRYLSKYLICITIMFLLTGCHVDYNLHLTKDGNSEAFALRGVNTSLDSGELIKNINTSYGMNYEVGSLYDIYDCNTIDCNPEKFTNPFGFYASRMIPSISDFNSNSIFKKYFGNVVITRRDNIYTLSAKPNINFKSLFVGLGTTNPLVTKVTINITSDFPVTDFNGKKTEEGTYTWIYTKDNYNEPIRFSYEVEETKEKTKKDHGKTISSIIFIILGIVSTVVVIYLLMKNKENDKV